MCSMNERTNEMTKHTRVNLLLAYPLITSLPTHFSPILLILPGLAPSIFFCMCSALYYTLSMSPSYYQVQA